MKRTLLATTALAFTAAYSANAQVANISTTDLTTDGINVSSSLVSAISNTYFANDGNTMLVVKNQGVAVTATLVTQATTARVTGIGPVSLSNVVVPIPPSSTMVVGPFPRARWNSTVYDTVYVSFTSVTGISETAIRIPLN